METMEVGTIKEPKYPHCFCMPHHEAPICCKCRYIQKGADKLCHVSGGCLAVD